MAFTDRDYVIKLVEELLYHSWPRTLAPMSTPFQRITYAEAIEDYGTDQPDTRLPNKV